MPIDKAPTAVHAARAEHAHCESVCDDIVDALDIDSNAVTDAQGCAVTEIVRQQRALAREDLAKVSAVLDSKHAKLVEVADKLSALRDAIRKEAAALRADTLTSMCEGVCNERMADYLEKLVSP